MDTNDIPIFKKLYELYKLLYQYRANVPKADRYSLWQRAEDNCLGLLELIIGASSSSKTDKLPALQTASVKLNSLRFLVRLAYETKAIDLKRYTTLQKLVDEIGRMLGGWIRSVKPNPPPAFWLRQKPALVCI